MSTIRFHRSNKNCMRSSYYYSIPADYVFGSEQPASGNGFNYNHGQSLSTPTDIQ